MLLHYIKLALLSLRRSKAMTTLIVAAIGVGIGTAMSVYSMLHAMSGDPIPGKSSQLFVPQIDNWGPAGQGDSLQKVNGIQDLLTYRDAIALIQSKQAENQTATYPLNFFVTSTAGAAPFRVSGRAVYGDFFKMFEVPFREGNIWNTGNDEDRSNVAIIGAKLADRLFPEGNAVGKTISLNNSEYQIVGVLQPWYPRPRFYDVTNGRYSDTEDIFLPFATAIDREMRSAGNSNCKDAPPTGWKGYLGSECIWIGFWATLSSKEAVQDYRMFLHNYAAEQQRSGRFSWPARTALTNLKEWLTAQKVVPDEVRISAVIAFAFLVVCLVNSAGLLLARFSTQIGELVVRRALGAAKADIFAQCLTETAVVGALGGLLGLALTAIGIWLERAIVPSDLGRLLRLDVTMMAITLLLAIFATVCAGVYPTWRASRVQPAWQLKGQ